MTTVGNNRSTLVVPAEIDRSGTARNGESEYGHYHLDGLRGSNSAGLGVANDTTVRDYRGQLVAREADALVMQARGNLQLIGVDAALGNQDNIGANYRASVDSSADIGGYVASSWNDEGASISGRGGAYVGTDVSEEVNLGFRYFGFGSRASVGVGAGMHGGGSLSDENGRLSLTSWAQGGLGVTGGTHNQAWIDYGRIGQDISDAANWVGNSISSFFAAASPSRATIS